jgi:hypothetical protein
VAFFFPFFLFLCADQIPGLRHPPAVTRAEPDFSFKMQPSALARRKDNGSAPKGKLLVKLICARNLASPSVNSRPYAVVTFDQNEFVSREPIREDDEEVVGIPTVRAEGSPLGGSPGSSGSKEASPTPSPASGDSSKSSGLSRVLGGHRNSVGTNGHGEKAEAKATNGEETKKEAKAATSPDSSAFGTTAAYNPTWKHEVNL